MELYDCSSEILAESGRIFQQPRREVMKKYAFALAVAVVSFSTAGAYAGGFGGHGSKGGGFEGHSGNGGVSSGSLINVSPSIGLGNIAALNNVLNGTAILSGSGNSTNILSGILGSVSSVLNQGNSTRTSQNFNSKNSYKLGRR